MKFQRFKDMAIGAIIAGMIVGIAPAAYAKVANMNIPVSFNNIKILIDGTELKTDKEPFIYEGTTYLPVRAVGEAVGKTVGWDGATNTVTLNTAAAETPAEKPETPSNTVLYEKDGIKITATGLSESFIGKNIDLQVENTTAKSYTIQVRQLSVNGYMVEPVFSCEVAAGKKANDGITILTSYLEKNGITEITEAEFSFHIFESDDWSQSIDTDLVQVKF